MIRASRWFNSPAPPESLELTRVFLRASNHDCNAVAQKRAREVPLRSLFLSLAGLAALTASAFAHWPPQLQIEQLQIAENVWMMQHPPGSSNSMFIVTQEGRLISPHRRVHFQT